MLNMGTPVRIVDLANDMIHLAGVENDGIDIVYTGRRPGEKLHESLFDDDEGFEATSDPGILVARDGLDFDELTTFEIDRLVEAAVERDWSEMDRSLRALLPGFRSEGAIVDGTMSDRSVASLIEELP